MHTNELDIPMSATHEPGDDRRTLLMTGVAEGAWAAQAAPLADTLAAAGWTVRVLPLDEALREASSGPTRVLGWIDAPHSLVAHRLLRGDLDDAWLARWSEQAGAMVRAARFAPQRWMLVDAEEVAAAPAALGDGLSAWLGLGAECPVPAPADADPALRLAHFIARVWLNARPRWIERHEELVAACAVLDDGFTERAPGPDAADALQDLQALLARHGAAVASAQSGAAHVAQLQGRLDEALRTTRELQERLSHTGSDVDEGLQRLHAAQEEIERVSLRLAEAERRVQESHSGALAAQARAEAAHARLAAAEAETQRLRESQALAGAQFDALTQAHRQAIARLQAVEASEAQIPALRQALDERTAERDAASQRAARAESLHAADVQERDLLNRRMDVLRADAERLREEGLDLLSRLHESQESVERMALQQQFNDAARDFGHDTGRVLPAIAEARCLGVQDSGTHRHADFELLGLRWAGQERARVDVRLVDHHGHPGLLFWGQPEPERCLSVWSTNGDEAGRPFMLLVVEDPVARRRIESLGTSDWVLLQAVARSLVFACRFDAGLARWAMVADRLCRLLDGMAPRLRYDALSVTGRGGELGIEARRVHFGAAELGDVHWHWSTGSRRLVWQCPRDGRVPPLLGWPLDEDGMPADRFVLPVGEAMNAGAWSALPPADQLLVRGVLDLLSGAAEQLPAGPDRAQGVAAALALRQQTGSALRAMRARGIARRLMGRGTRDR